MGQPSAVLPTIAADWLFDITKLTAPCSAMKMGMDTLEKLAAILKDLTSARSIRLINVRHDYIECQAKNSFPPSRLVCVPLTPRRPCFGRTLWVSQALDEREQLENDASVKKRVLAHIIAISKERAGKAGPGSSASPTSSPSKTPALPPKFKSLSPFSGTPKNGSAASGKQPAASASAPVDAKPPPAKDRSWFRRF